MDVFCIKKWVHRMLRYILLLLTVHFNGCGFLSVFYLLLSTFFITIFLKYVAFCCSIYVFHVIVGWFFGYRICSKHHRFVVKNMTCFLPCWREEIKKRLELTLFIEIFHLFLFFCIQYFFILLLYFCLHCDNILLCLN